MKREKGKINIYFVQLHFKISLKFKLINKIPKGVYYLSIKMQIRHTTTSCFNFNYLCKTSNITVINYKLLTIAYCCVILSMNY